MFQILGFYTNTKKNETEPTWVDEVFKMQKEEEQQNIVSKNQSNSVYNDSHENGDIVAFPIKTSWFWWDPISKFQSLTW